MERQCPARDQPGQLPGLVVFGWALAQVRVALGLVDDDLQAEDVHVVADLGLKLPDLLPGGLVAITVYDALHQRDDGERQAGVGRRAAPARVKVTRGKVAVRPRPSASVQVTRSWQVSLKTAVKASSRSAR